MNFFVGTGSNLAKNIPSVEGNNREFFNSVLTQTGNSIFLQLVVPQEIVEIVSAFKGNKSPGFDDISPLIIKTVISFIAEPLAAVINTSFSQDMFPDTLKLAKVI